MSAEDNKARMLQALHRLGSEPDPAAEKRANLEAKRKDDFRQLLQGIRKSKE